MIHSLSGGVIRDNFKRTFVKVEIDGAPYWYLSPTANIAAGAKVSVPFGKSGLPREGVVVKVEEADAQCAPIPMNRARELYKIL